MHLVKHAVSPEIANALKLGSGILWTLTYLLILRKARKDKTYGMPMVALGANLGWEFLYSFVLPHQNPQLSIDRVWLAFDVLLLWQTLRYGKGEMANPFLHRWFLPAVGLSVGLGFLVVRGMALDFQDPWGVYSAFGQNLMMSVLFVQMLLLRGNSRGQSIWIALCKLFGTVLPSILFCMHFPDSQLLPVLYLSILLFDGIYVALLWSRLRAEGRDPWTVW
jgi:hypothetical protein